MIHRLGTFDEMFDLFRDVDRLLRRPTWHGMELPGENFSMPRALPVATGKTPFFPAVECFTRDKMLVLRAELPGVDPKDVEVSITGNQVFLRGEKKEEHKADEKDFFFREISHGEFERTFSLPEGVKADQIKASFLNGVLELSMPSGVLEQTRKVPIEIGEGTKKVKAA